MTLKFPSPWSMIQTSLLHASSQHSLRASSQVSVHLYAGRTGLEAAEQSISLVFTPCENCCLKRKFKVTKMFDDTGAFRGHLFITRPTCYHRCALVLCINWFLCTSHLGVLCVLHGVNFILFVNNLKKLWKQCKICSNAFLFSGISGRTFLQIFYKAALNALKYYFKK